jgi:tripartite-type tricarboxylate transporter receptor subunit TctC
MRFQIFSAVMLVVTFVAQPSAVYAASLETSPQGERAAGVSPTSGSPGSLAYPEKPIRIVVPQTPGSSTDFFARLVGEGLHERLRVPVVVDNRPGAGGRIGLEIVSGSEADGYTLTVTTEGSLTIAPHLYRSLPYDTLKDFAPITRVATAPYVLVVSPGVPVGTVAELIALAKAKPGTINFASGGNGTGTHLSGELFKLTANIDIVHVPYKGGSPALRDTIGGRIHMLFVGLPPSISHIQAGRLRALGVTTRNRSALLMDVPTVAESGLPGFRVEPWWGIFAPAAVPRPRVNKIYSEAVAVLKDPDLRRKLASHGAVALGDAPEEVRSVVIEGYEKWGDVVKKSKVRIQ